MATCFLFDVDGVLLRPPRFYSRVLAEQGYPAAPGCLDEYYRSDRTCVTGREDPLEKVKPFLDRFAWPLTARDYFDRQFEYERTFLDEPLLQLIGELRSVGVRCFLATDQDHLRKDKLLNDLDFRHQFDGWFVSAEIGFRKVERGFWHRVLQALADVPRKQILFIDDRLSNLEEAERHGIAGFQVSTEAQAEALKVRLGQKEVWHSYEG